MLDIFLKLIDRCIELGKRREQVNRELFNDFVTPAFSDFEKLHENYIDSFIKYRNLLLDDRVHFDRNHPILTELENDALFSGNLRTKAYSLKEMEDDPIIGEFIKSIASYIEGVTINPLIGYRSELDASSERLERLGIANVIREGFNNGILEILHRFRPDDENRNSALELLDEIVNKVQLSHRKVNKEYSSLKVQLLKKK